MKSAAHILGATRGHVPPRIFLKMVQFVAFSCIFCLEKLINILCKKKYSYYTLATSYLAPREILKHVTIDAFHCIVFNLA